MPITPCNLLALIIRCALFPFKAAETGATAVFFPFPAPGQVAPAAAGRGAARSPAGGASSVRQLLQQCGIKAASLSPALCFLHPDLLEAEGSDLDLLRRGLKAREIVVDCYSSYCYFFLVCRS